MAKSHYILTGFILTLSACNSVTQSKFWTDYRADEITEREAYQSDYDGRRTIHWEMKSGNPVSAKEVLDIASRNGWTVVDTQLVTQEDLASWSISDTLIFPLYYDGTYEMWSKENPGSWTAFIRYIATDFSVYRCKTKERLTFLGSRDWTDENGYILLSENRNQMTVYHLWDNGK